MPPTIASAVCFDLVPSGLKELHREEDGEKGGCGCNDKLEGHNKNVQSFAYIDNFG